MVLAAETPTPDLTSLADKPLPVAVAILFAVLFLASIPYWGPPLKDAWSARVAARSARPPPTPGAALPPAVAQGGAVLPQVVDASTDYAQRYMDSLEQRVRTADAHIARLQERLDREEHGYYEKIRALEADNAQLRAQLNAMLYGRGTP